MKLRAFTILSLLMLSACSHEPPRGGYGRDQPPSPRTTEKAVMHALGEVGASDQQRTDILNAYDRDDAERRSLATEAEDLRRQMGRLSKTQPDYVALMEPLARRQGQQLTESVLIQARFDQAVAATLTPEQLDRWDAQMQGASDRGGTGLQGGGGRHRRGSSGDGMGGGL